MGLTLRVAGAANAFESDHAAVVAAAVERSLGYRLPARVGFLRRHSSSEMGWSWIDALREDAAHALGDAASPHLHACDSWCSVYLPRELTPTTVALPSSGPATVTTSGHAALDAAVQQVVDTMNREAPAGTRQLVCASAPALVRELSAYGSTRELAVDMRGLRRLLRRYRRPDMIDADPHVQAFAALLQAAHLACERGLPLWVVK